ncbi:beta lactamase-like protein, putative [Bodo saltans]|uniref:Beta lactamase-like protein, putative n=2 Tax=Bodo saltans TaxID=75058 RepID=A0A0S4KJ31_BODSA|nr:beta lactamase-like protein, putative [Bodo saltans]|eukprot:CUI14287.1 beta lactamase-like protein, putative [Bodo saltans]
MASSHCLLVTVALILVVFIGTTIEASSVRNQGPAFGPRITPPYPQALLNDLDGVFRVSLDDGTTLFENETGYLNIPFAAPMTSSSRFMIGSNSKLYTTVALYQLQEQGKFRMTDSVASLFNAQDFINFGLANQTQWCPTLPGKSGCQVITVRQLLSMSSGIYPALNCRVYPYTECREDVFFVNPGSIGLVVGTFLNSPLIFAPGTEYQYSNPNFIIGAYLVEKFSNMTFQAYLDAHIFQPAGLQNTYFDAYNGQLGQIDLNRTYEYFKFYDNTTFERIGYGPVTLELDTGAVSGTGGIISTPHDEALFYRVLFNKTSKGAPLLRDPASQAAILSAQNFMGTTPFNNSLLYSYYSQGVIVMCSTEQCASGSPDFIEYEGGMIGSTTANLYDYRAGRGGLISQAWTSSKQYIVSECSLNAVRAMQVGNVIGFLGDWAQGAPDPNNLMWLNFFAFTR